MSTTRGRQLTGGIAAAAGLIAGITLLARVTGFARWLVFSGNVGTTCAGTVYNAANTLPNVLYEVAAGGALAAVAVPLIARQLGRGDEEAGGGGEGEAATESSARRGGEVDGAERCGHAGDPLGPGDYQGPRVREQ